MYKYETHLHTAPVSRCASADVETTLRYYKDLGYDGVFITNHFLDGNFDYDEEKSYKENVERNFSDYEKGVEIGKELGIKVFFGCEINYGGTEFLVYGLDKEWFIAHPEYMDMIMEDKLNLLKENGAFIIQAHPFREANYIYHLRLYPRHVHGVEALNANRHTEENDMAKIYAEHYGLLCIAGSDNHSGPNQKKLAGICCEEPICSVEDFIEKVKTEKTKIFTFKSE